MIGSQGLKDHTVEVADKDQVALARSFAWTAVTAYCRIIGIPLRPAPGDVAPLPAYADAGAIGVAEWAAGMDPADAAHMLGAAYTAALPRTHRSLHGVFYTPPALVKHLLDMAEAAGLDWRRARVLDPACGGGAFLVAAATRMAASLAHLEPAFALRWIGQHLAGFELDPFGAWMAQVMVDAQLASLTRQAGQVAPTVVKQRDSLDIEADDLGHYDAVIGNPPYSRVTPSKERRAAYGRSIYGHANLYGLFTDAGLRWTAAGGIIGYVTPTSMLSGLYYKALRALLRQEAPPVAFGLLADRAGIFADVLQETMLAVYRRDDEREPACRSTAFLTVDGGNTVRSVPAGSFTLPDDDEAPWLLPRNLTQVALTRDLRSMPHRLSDYGYGVSTGPLVWNRHKPQLHSTRGTDAYPIVWAESVTMDGRFVWKTERRNHAPWFWARLPKDKWVITDRPCVLLQRTTAKEQARRLIAAVLPETFICEHQAVVVENHLNMVRPLIANPKIPARAVAALLNSDAADAAFRCINGSVAVSAYELEGMPVPPPATMLRVARMIEEGASRSDLEAEISLAYAGVAAAGRDGHAATP